MHETKNQQGFVRKQSMLSNMLQFMQNIYTALNSNSKESIVASFADFSNAFDRVPHEVLVRKPEETAVCRDQFDINFHNLEMRKEFDQMEKQCSDELRVSSCIPQGSLIWGLLYYISL